MGPRKSAEEPTEGTVTVLFTDVEGSTELRRSLGDEAAHQILRALDELVRGQIAAHHGREVKGTGDGVMASFASARRAVTCAAGIQRALEDRNRERGEASVTVRVGVNSGEVNHEADDIFGTAVNAAARVAAKARGGQILVSGVVKQLAGQVPDISYVDRGRFRLKGFDERWQLFEVIWKREAGNRGINAHLAVESTEGLRLVPLEAGRVTIGRGIENSLALSDDQKVSRLHASLENYGAGWLRQLAHARKRSQRNVSGGDAGYSSPRARARGLR